MNIKMIYIWDTLTNTGHFVANNAMCPRSRVVRKSGNVSTAFAFYKKQFLIIAYNDLRSASESNFIQLWEMEITLNYESRLSNVGVANKVKTPQQP